MLDSDDDIIAAIIDVDAGAAADRAIDCVLSIAQALVRDGFELSEKSVVSGNSSSRSQGSRCDRGETKRSKIS